MNHSKNFKGINDLEIILIVIYKYIQFLNFIIFIYQQYER